MPPDEASGTRARIETLKDPPPRGAANPGASAARHGTIAVRATAAASREICAIVSLRYSPDLQAALLNALTRGVRVRLIHPIAKRGSLTSLHHLAPLACAGGGIRTLDVVGGEMLLGDRSTAMLAPVSQAVVVDQRPMVDVLHCLFDTMWLHGRPAFAAGMAPLSTGDDELLRVLADGLTDVTGARLLGVSGRTYTRRVARVMEWLGAESRFQAGVLAGRLGLV